MHTTKKVTRKLAAILSADVKGYSLLMADDEVHTIDTLKKYRQIMANIIQEHSGHVVDNPGDNLLAEFASVVDALDCSVDIQKKLKKENAKFVEGKRLKFRIGVNIGDIVQDDMRIYGSGVNIAARIQSIADAGGISISQNTYEQVKDKLDYRFEYLGEHDVKNIKEPVRVYRIVMDSGLPKPIVEQKLKLPDKPSIAVLPFDNMSGDPSQEYFSDGLTDQIINGLCKVSNLFVIARNSSFAYKGKAVSIKQIADELSVKYILEGSVQRAGDRVRITAQLIDAKTDYHKWSENFDREFEDIFALQDEITFKIINALEIKLTMGEQARLWYEKGVTSNIQAFDKLMGGNECFFRFTEKDNKQAQHFYKEAINIDEGFTMAYIMLGATHIMDLLYGWSKSPIESFEQAEINVEKSLALDDSIDLAHGELGYICLLKGQHDEAIKAGERAIELNPNGAEAHNILGVILIFSDKIESAIKLLERAMRLNPIPQPYYYSNLAMAYRYNGQNEKAIELAKKALRGNPDQLAPYLTFAASYSSLNRTEEASKAVQEILRMHPHFTVERHSNIIPFRNQEELDKYINALRKAGLPE